MDFIKILTNQESVAWTVFNKHERFFENIVICKSNLWNIGFFQMKYILSLDAYITKLSTNLFHLA